MAAIDERKPLTVPALAVAREAGRKLTMLTAYDAGFARVLDAAGIDLVLVGDSLGMVVQGHDSTLPVRVDDIAYHTACVARGLSHALLVADLPFQADASPERALDAATTLLRAGAKMVKLEGAGL
jgi:3-methyl-2-oxobutanoate hydroxymethyltransferase